MKLPHKFGKYVLLKKIAHGGMAEIYKAKYYGERGFTKDVAVKRILPVWSERKDFENMLVDEAKALVHLQHQNIVQVYELGKDDDYFYISMEYVDGMDLRHVYKKLEKEGRKIPEKFACFVITEVLKALEFAHRGRGDSGEFLDIVHRDISPQNILLSYNGEVKLTDFGIAKGLHRDQQTTTTKLKGKYAYMSPEQAGGGEIDHRSDIYSLGIVFYEILTGSRLFESASDFETIKNVRESRLPDGWEARVTLNMRKILRKALAKDLNRRYQTAAEFLKDIDGYVSLKKLHTHGLELSDYLNQLFSGCRDEQVEQRVEKARTTRIFTSVSNMKKSGCENMTISRRYAALIVLFMPLLLASVFRSGNGGDTLFIKRSNQMINETAKIPDPKADKILIGPEMPEVGSGLISIDTNPPGASGTLTYGDVKKDFTTPFILAGLDIDGEIPAKLTLKKEGFDPIVDNLTLSKDNATFSKAYKLKSDVPSRISVQARPWGYVYIPGVVNKKESPVHGVRVKPGRYNVKVFYSPTNTWARAGLDVKPGRSHQCVADFTKGGKMWCK